MKAPRKGDVEKIGVLLVQGQIGILSDIVRDVLEAHPSVSVVATIDDSANISDAVTRSGCDAVVWMLDASEPTKLPEDLLRRHPSLRIVAVDGSGERGSLWLMRPHRTPLGMLSPERIVAELRGPS